MTVPDLHREIASAVERAAGGRASALHLHGRHGSGRTWWLGETQRTALSAGMVVLSGAGIAAERDVPFGTLASLLGPLRSVRVDEETDRVVDDLLAHRPSPGDPLAVRLAVFRLLCRAAQDRPVCLLVDDLDEADDDSAHALTFSARRADADALLLMTTSTRSAAAPWRSHRVPDTCTADLTALLVARGVAPSAASGCAAGADGLPGLAVALADGLTAAQRGGTVELPDALRPAGALADHWHATLRAHGDAVCRALVVAALDPDGDVGTVRAALHLLGETSEGLDAAEEAGVLALHGTHLTITDPWVRTTAPHLVAAASRRAAHRALAAASTAPHRAARRAHHLAAGADGPDEAVAEALELVAHDSARRGALAHAARTAERAAAFSTEASARQQRLLDALWWWMTMYDVDGVQRVLGALTPLDLEAETAVAEALEFLDGERRAVTAGSIEQPDSAPADSRWIRRRDRRLRIVDALTARDHSTVLLTVGEGAHDADDLVALAMAHRDRSDLLAARQYATAAAVTIGDSTAHVAQRLHLVLTDLDALSGGVPTGTARRVDPELAALSQAELRVAEAVAAGLTNREAATRLFISVKTVDFHLQQMYRKLGLRSRTELAVRMAAHDPSGAAR